MSVENQHTVAVLGASQSREKFGNKAVRAYLAQGFEVFPINPHAAEIEGLTAYASLADLPVDSVDQISVYLPPHVGMALLEEIDQLHPKEVWLNPGSESPEILEKASQLGIPIVQACSILGMGRTPGEFEN